MVCHGFAMGIGGAELVGTLGVCQITRSRYFDLLRFPAESKTWQPQ